MPSAYQRHLPLPGEQTLKHWREAKARQFRVSPFTIDDWRRHGYFPKVKIRRPAKGVVFVTEPVRIKLFGKPLIP
jgi:hypothetical protein